MAAIYYEQGNTVQALNFYRAGNTVVSPGALDILNGYNGMAKVFEKMNRPDSAAYFAKKAVEGGLKKSHFPAVIYGCSLLVGMYKLNHAVDSAFKYQEIMLAAKDSIFSQDKVKLVLNLSSMSSKRQQQLEQARKEARQQLRPK
jgi:hypothetical protein